MKKLVIAIAIGLSTILFADIISDLQAIDKEIQKKNYYGALNKSREMLKKNINEDDRRAIESVISDIENRIKSTGKVLTNIGQENIDVTENEELKASDDGTLLSLPSEKISDASKFTQYKNYEKQVVSTGNADAIHSLAMLYIKESLYESAMNLALRDKTRNVKNIFLAATAARMIGRFDKSIKLYNEVLSKNSNHAKSYLGLAMAYKGKGDFSQAQKYLKMSNEHSQRIQHDLGVLGSL